MSPDDIPFSYLAQLLLEAAAFLGIAIVAAGRLRDGSWAGLATFGGVLASVQPLIGLAVWFEMKLFESSHVVNAFYLSPNLSDLIAWTLPVGVIMIAVAVVQLAQGSRRRAARWS